MKKKPMKKNNDYAYFKKEYESVIENVRKLISKKDAIKLYNSLIHDDLGVFFKKLREEYPELDKYYEKD